MKMSEVVRPGPGQYISKRGALSILKEKAAKFSNPVIITGVLSYEAFLKFSKESFDYPVLRYDQTASHEDMERLSKEAKEKNADVIIGIGGGKLLDTAKGTAQLLGIDIITVPTVASTCSAYTPISAVYHPDHSFKCVDFYDRAIYLSLVDLDILVNSPRPYFESGVSDTLAKWYEAEGIVRHMTPPLPALVQSGVQAAKLTQEILLKDSKEAFEALDAKTVNEGFQRIVDTVIAIAGTVGGFAGAAGRMSGAHSVHNALSLFHETHKIHHGVKVAYGILVQLVASKDEDEVKKLFSYYKDNNFIYTYRDLGIKEDFEIAKAKIADFVTSDKESFKLAVVDATPESVIKAIDRLEVLARDYEKTV